MGIAPTRGDRRALAVILTAPLAKRLVGRPGAFFAVAFAAASFHGLTLSNDAKPYTIDALMTTLILWAGARLFATPGRSGWLPIICLGAIAPWLSYPTIFTLAGVGVAWILHAILRRDRGAWLGIVLYGVAGLGSFLLLWLVAARHQRTGVLTDYWRGHFVDLSTTRAALTSTVSVMRHLGEYMSTGLGIPFMALVPIGWFVLARRDLAIATMLFVPLALALIASRDARLSIGGPARVFCRAIDLDSCIGCARRGMPAAGAGAKLAVDSGAVVAAGCRLGQNLPNCAGAMLRPGIPRALEYVNAKRLPGDVIWQPYIEVYQLYHDRATAGFGTEISHADLLRLARGHRLWLISLPDGSLPGQTPLANMQTDVAAAGWVQKDKCEFHHVVVLLYENVEPAPRDQPIKP